MTNCQWCDAGYPITWSVNGPLHLTHEDWAMKWWEPCANKGQVTQPVSKDEQPVHADNAPVVASAGEQLRLL